jgi:DNA-binding beta-propeller fold protein YncE
MPGLRTRSLVVLVPIFLAAALPVAGDGAEGVAAEGLGLAQVTCVAQADPSSEDSTYSASCAPGKALLGAASVAVSSDGRNVYVAAADASALMAYSRSGALGQLAPIGCASNNGTNGLDGTKHSCADGDALKGAYDIALSPDGKNVYVAASDSGGIAVFTRDPATGKIVQTGCVRGVSTCVGARALAGAAAVVVSPDGRNVYLASYGADAVVMFQRDPVTGALKGLGCISDDGTDRQCASGNALRGAGALAMTKDGRWLYVAAASSNSVLTFERDPATGLLTQRGCVLDHAPARGSCVSGNALLSPWALALAPDDRTLFVVSYDSDAIDVFARDATTGKIAERGCLSDTTYSDNAKDGCVHTVPLVSPTDVAVSPDGHRVYVTNEAGLTLLERDPVTGGLIRAGCALSRGYDYDPTDKQFEQCIVGHGIEGAAGVAASGDGRSVYVAADTSNALAVFTPAAALRLRRNLSEHGVVAVRVSCPAEVDGTCGGRLTLTRPETGRAAAEPQSFEVAPGRARTVFLRLTAAALKSPTMRLLLGATDRRPHVAPIEQHVSIRRPVPRRRRRG